VPFPYPKIIVGTRHCRLLRGPKEETAVPFPYPKIIIGKRHCRLLRGLRITTRRNRVFSLSLTVINNYRKNPVSGHLSIIWGGKKLGMRNTC